MTLSMQVESQVILVTVAVRPAKICIRIRPSTSSIDLEAKRTCTMKSSSHTVAGKPGAQASTAAGLHDPQQHITGILNICKELAAKQSWSVQTKSLAAHPKRKSPSFLGIESFLLVALLKQLSSCSACGQSRPIVFKTGCLSTGKVRPEARPLSSEHAWLSV